MSECVVCGTSNDLTRTCNYCGKQVCSKHTLPEKHDCPATKVTDDSGKRFESNFEATIGETDDSSESAPNAMDKDKIRTYGSEKTDDTLDSSPAVRTKSDDSSNASTEGDVGTSRWKRGLSTIAGSLKGVGGRARSKLSFSRRSRTGYSNSKSYGWNRRRILGGVVTLASLGSTGWLATHNDGDIDETIEDLQDIPARLSTGGVSEDGSKTFAASENFDSVSWDVDLQSATLVVDLAENHEMDWFRVKAGGYWPEETVARVQTPAGKQQVEVDLLDQLVENDLPSGRWRLEAFEGPTSEEADSLGHVVWKVAGNAEFQGIPVVDTSNGEIEIVVENTGTAPVVIKEMQIDDYEPVAVGGFRLIAPEEEGKVGSIGTPFREGCIPESYELSVSGTPSTSTSMDISSTMGSENC